MYRRGRQGVALWQEATFALAIHAAMRADALLDHGDMDGVAVWKRILKAVDELLADGYPETPNLALGFDGIFRHLKYRAASNVVSFCVFSPNFCGYSSNLAASR